jgi:SAM-dependent methyltransferase
MSSTSAGADPYFLGYRHAEQLRLQRQAEQLAVEAAWLLDRIGPLDGGRVVELGCGPRGYLDELSERVGPGGTVVGVERNAEAVAHARLYAAERGLGNVELVHGDARATGLPDGGFDLVAARLVLVNVPQPEELVAEAVRLVRPGGAVAFHEADALTHLCDPPLDAWTRLRDRLERYAELNGVDLFVGRRLPRLLREAGLVDVQARPRVYLDEPGNPRHSILTDFVGNLRERLLRHELIAPEELAELQARLKRHLADPDTLVYSHLFVQAWGRKPHRRPALRLAQPADDEPERPPPDGPRERLFGLLSGYMPTQLAHVMARLRIADLLDGTSMTVGELSSATGTKPDLMRRLVRGLTGVGLVAEADGRIALTEMGALLRRRTAASMRDIALHRGGESYPASGKLEHAVRTGQPACEAAHGEPFFKYLRSNREAGAAFNGTMTRLSQGVVDESVARSRWT